MDQFIVIFGIIGSVIYILCTIHYQPFRAEKYKVKKNIKDSSANINCSRLEDITMQIDNISKK